MFVGKIICDHCNQPNMAKAIECIHCGKALHETVAVSDSFREELRQRIAKIQAKNPAAIRLSIVEDHSRSLKISPQMSVSSICHDVLLIEEESGKQYQISRDSVEEVLV